MSTFKSPHNPRTISVWRHEDSRGVVVRAEDTRGFISVYLDPADAPAIALDVLEAGGVTPSAGADTNTPEGCYRRALWLLRDGLAQAEYKAEAAAEEAARAKRRDELANALMKRAGSPDDGWTYDALHDDVTKTAVDMLLDAENELVEERNK